MFILLTKILSLNIQIDVCPDLTILLVDHWHCLVDPKILTVICDWYVNLFVVFVAKDIQTGCAIKLILLPTYFDSGISTSYACIHHSPVIWWSAQKKLDDILRPISIVLP